MRTASAWEVLLIAREATRDTEQFIRRYAPIPVQFLLAFVARGRAGKRGEN